MVYTIIVSYSSYISEDMPLYEHVETTLIVLRRAEKKYAIYLIKYSTINVVPLSVKKKLKIIARFVIFTTTGCCYIFLVT
jgi:hypothetical protein